MKTFKSPKAFAAHLLALAEEAPIMMHHSADKIGAMVAETARAEIGNPDMYDPRMAGGPFSAWPGLLPATEAQKARLGFPVDAPLLRRGDLRDSIGHDTESEGVVHTAVVGSTDPRMPFFEDGTLHMPPRPVIGPAVFMSLGNIEAGLGRVLFTLVSGQSWKRYLLTNWRRHD